MQAALDSSEGNDDDADPVAGLHSLANARCRDIFKCDPKAEQLQVLVNISNKKDTILIAPCGWGKSLAFFLPMVCWTDCIIVIISPLKALMKNQQKKLYKHGIPHLLLTKRTSTDKDKATIDQAAIDHAAIDHAAIDHEPINDPAVNHTTVDVDVINKATIRSIVDGRYRAIFMSPEIVFHNKLVEGLWDMDVWATKLTAIVVDEVHCVDRWGGEFRPCYNQLGLLRAKVGEGIPIVGLTATLTDGALSRTVEKLHLQMTTEVIHVKEFRMNLHLSLNVLSHRNQLALLAKDFRKEMKTIVYFESIKVLNEAYYEMLSRKPELQFGVYFSLLHDEYKEIVMSWFEKGELDVLLATEAAGMGCDIPGVSRIIQYGFPRDMTSLMQRFGRAAREPGMQGFCTLMAPAITSKTPTDPDLRTFVSTAACRWAEMDKLFGAAAHRRDFCCDLCDKARGIKGRLPPVVPLVPPAPLNIVCDSEPSNRKKKKMIDEHDIQGALKVLDDLAENFFDEWEDKLPISSPSWTLPKNHAKTLSENFHMALTPESVERLTVGWGPVKRPDHFVRVAEALKAHYDAVVARHGKGT